jgi:hypothetical protein
MITAHYYRLVDLQYRCFIRGHKKWAIALGKEIKAFHADNPQFKPI